MRVTVSARQAEPRSDTWNTGPGTQTQSWEKEKGLRKVYSEKDTRFSLCQSVWKQLARRLCPCPDSIIISLALPPPYLYLLTYSHCP